VPKRTFWLVTGAAIGAGSSLWAERKVRRAVQQATARLQPDAIVVEVGRSARQAAGTAGDRVRDAVSSGRDEMQRREEELWAELAAPGVEHPVSAAPPGSIAPSVPAAAHAAVAHAAAPGTAPDASPGAPARRPAAPRGSRALGRLRRAPAKSASHLGN
jgi:hypothetical protein